MPALETRRRAFAALVCTLLAACGGGADDPSASHDLVFDHQDADGSRRLLRSAAAEGAVPAPVPGGGDAVRPQARSDGQAIVYTFYRPDPLATPQLMLLERAGAVVTRLSTDADIVEREPVYSPDGQHIAFVSARDEPGGADIFVARLDGRQLGRATNLTPPGGPRAVLDVTPAWSPDGRRIVFSSARANGVNAIWVMDADGRGLRALTEVPPTGAVADYFPSWSPDGRHVAFQRRTLDVEQIGIVPADGGAPGFFAFPGRAGTPAWSPDGRHIAFSGLADGDWDIFVQPVAGGAPLRIRHPGADRSPAWIRRP